jgi:hypothetical protein
MRRVALRLDVPLSSAVLPSSLCDELLRDCETDDEKFLDLVHTALNVPPASSLQRQDAGHERLEQILSDGGSAWRATERGLQRRVHSASQNAFDRASAPAGWVSDQLQEAWERAYGRQPNAGHAWYHSIKAVEAVLIPIVVPKKDKPNLGDVIGQLRGQSHLWKLGIRGQSRDSSVEPLVGMLSVLWVEPNRHGSVSPEMPATLEEARAVVQLAVAIVQWGRDGQIVRK